MNDNTPVPGYAFQAGRILAGLHYKIVPIGPGKKYPPIQAWQDAATDDLVQVAQWLAETNYGIGWAMGLQPNGKHLFCLDIDGDLGVASLGELILEHGSTDTFTATCQQMTGSGGWHYIFESEFEVRNSASQFAPGIDIRGEGGQIVVGPTIHPNGQAYRWVKGPKRNPPQMAPAWIMERIAAQNVPAPQVPSLATVPVAALNGQHADDGETPFEWLNRTFDSEASLLRLGWTATGRAKGNEWQFTRPGKDPRQGTSATWHVDTGVVNVFSTSVDTIYHTVGKAGNGCITLTPADLWMVENGVTDRSEASRMIRRMMPQEAGAAAYKAPAVPVQGGTVQPDTAPGLNLPDEFWARRGWLSHIRDAAHNRQASADAILGAVIARYAAMVPPMYRIPPIVMTASTFDHISVLVAESAGGKSGAMAIARELLPGQQERKDLVWEWPVSSGEGLVSAFFEMVTKEVDGKKQMVNMKTKTAVHFSVDEALGLVNQSQRQGTTIGSVLCTAWSGGDPGQGNASADRQRVGMVPGSYRMAGVAAIQLSLGHKLLEDTFVQQGLSGRLVFFAAEDVNLPHWTVRPDWPGPLNLPVHPTMPVTIEYERSIHDEILEQNHQKMSKKAVVAPIDGHLNLVKLKMAGIFALMDDRTAVTEDDWDLAGLALRSHLALRNKMLAMRSQQNYEKTVTAATAQATFEDVKEEAKERRAVASLRDTILRHIPDEGIARGQLRKATTSTKTKHRFERALTKCIEDGAITIIDGRIHLT